MFVKRRSTVTTGGRGNHDVPDAARCPPLAYCVLNGLHTRRLRGENDD